MSTVDVSESPFASILETSHLPSEDEISAIQKYLVTLVAATTAFDKGISKLEKELKTLRGTRCSMPYDRTSQSADFATTKIP